MVLIITKRLDIITMQNSTEILTFSDNTNMNWLKSFPIYYILYIGGAGNA